MFLFVATIPVLIKGVEDYFNNNISIEVYTIDSDKKNENFDLVELNLLKDKLEAKETITASQKKKILMKPSKKGKTCEIENEKVKDLTKQLIKLKKI